MADFDRINKTYYPEPSRSVADRFVARAQAFSDRAYAGDFTSKQFDKALAEELRQAERDGALRVLEEVERVERTTCASLLTALREVRARITRGELP
jgi:hypothetical protein